MASFTNDPIVEQLIRRYQMENSNNPSADPFLFVNPDPTGNPSGGYWVNALQSNLPYLKDNVPGSIQLTEQQIGSRDVEGNPMQAVQQAMNTAGMSDYDRAKEALGYHRFMSRQQLSLDSLSPEDQAKVVDYMSGRAGAIAAGDSTNAKIFSALGPEASAKYGLTPQSIALDNADLLQAKEYGKDSDFHDNAAMNKQALITIGSILGSGFLFGAGGAGAGAGAGEAGAAAGSGAGYTGTTAELAADGLGGVDMWGGFGAGDAAAGTAGTAYYDSGAGMWVDSATGEGIASGTSVPSGYTAAEGSTALAAGDAAPALASEPSFLDTVKDYYKKGSNAKSLADALSSFTNSPQVSTGSVGGGFSPTSMPSGFSGGVSNTQGQNVMLENPIQQMESPQAQQPQQYGPLGMIDVTPATNTFLQSGSTWNQNMANALRNRNAY